jgi:acetolactate synthase I/II/III large subunit
LARLAERLSIPVATSLNAKEVLSEDHPLALGVMGTYGRWAANQVVLEADLVLLVGTRAGGHVTDGWRVPRPGTPTIQVDIEPQEIGRNYPVQVGMCADAQAALGALAEAAAPQLPRQAWLQRARSLLEAWREQALPMLRSDAAPVRPERVCHEVSEALPRDAVVVADTGHAAIWSATMLGLRAGQRYIRCAGTLGWAFPAAMGVKCALPQQQVLCFTGDGGLYYHLAEMETAARLGIATVTVVINNRSLRQTKGDWDSGYADRAERARPLWVFREVDLARVAESMGCCGMRVQHPAELRPALLTAFDSARPTLLDVVCDFDAVPPPPWATP